MSMFNDISWGSKDNEKECESSVKLVSLYAKRFFTRTMVILRTWIRKENVFYSRIQSTRRMWQSCRANDVNICRKQTPNLPIHESIIQRSAQESIHFCADGEAVETVFRTIISVNQLSIEGAVSDLCKECNTCHDRTGRHFVAGQSDLFFVPTSVMKTSAPSTDDLAQEDLLQKYEERVERLSQQNRVIKTCTDAGFLTTVGARQYFMTKDTEEFSQFTDSVACREYTLQSDENLSEPKGWIRGNTMIGPVLEVTTCCLLGKYGVEFRILNKLVTDSSNNKDNDNEQETSEMQFEEYALKLNARAFAKRSKAKTKPRRRTSASSSTKTIPIEERTWTNIEPQDYSPIGYPVSKKLTNLLRHGHLPREDDGARDERIIFGTILCILNIGLMKGGKVQWQKEEETRKDFSIALILQEKFFTSELFKIVQDAIPLILHYRTTYQIRTISSSTFFASEVQSIYTPPWIQDWYKEDKIWAKDRRYSSRLWILWTKNTEIWR